MTLTEFCCRRRILIFKYAPGQRLWNEEIDSRRSGCLFLREASFSLYFLDGLKYNMYIKVWLTVLLQRVYGQFRLREKPDRTAAKNRAARWPYGKQKKYKEKSAAF